MSCTDNLFRWLLVLLKAFPILHKKSWISNPFPGIDKLLCLLFLSQIVSSIYFTFVLNWRTIGGLSNELLLLIYIHTCIRNKALLTFTPCISSVCLV